METPRFQTHRVISYFYHPGRLLSITPQSSEAPFYILESNDWVNVIPVTENGEIVLIRQFRFGIEEVTLEIPGGIVGPGSTPLEAERKELLEETGYTSIYWEYLGVVHPNPAFLNNRCHSFLARDVKKIAEITPEESEEIEVLQVPLWGNQGINRTGNHLAFIGDLCLSSVSEPVLFFY